MGEEVIETRNLVKRFGSLTAVNNISFDVGRGEIFGFLGPNGAGKTTTINILVTIMKPTAGEAYVGGYDVTKDPIKVRELIGVVFQDNTVDRNLTGYENLYIHGMIYGLRGSDLRRRIDDVLEFVDLTKFKNVVVKNYSGGMMRRLEIARALMHNPQILFLDEPTLGLDPQTRAHIWDYILDLRRKYNITVFLTTHYMDEAEKLCNRVAIIDHGKIVAMDSPENLITSLSGDIIYIKLQNIDGRVREYAEHLVYEHFASSYKILDSNTIALNVYYASKALPVIFEKANISGIKILEVKYTQPSLGDVFLYYTGRELRDEEGSWKDMVRVRMMRRGRFH